MTYKIKTPVLVVLPKSENQKEYLKTIGENTVTFGVGPAGTGKTFLAVAVGVEMLMRQFNQHTKNNAPIKRMVIARPAVEAGERLGFLPGDMTEKIDPYMRPIFDALYETLGVQVEKFLEDMTIEVAPLAFMRGRTLKDSVIILDEAQNATRAQMKMFLTRIGFNTKTIINGDLTQSDLPTGQESGLAQAIRILDGVPHIGISKFTGEDVVRHPVVRAILSAYEDDQKCLTD